ncbi:MAG: DUF2784 domain-containing protein [Acidobacteriota bacterium]
MIRLLADFVLVVHLFFVLFVLFGGFLVVFRRHWIWAHIPAALWGVAISVGGWICPLTPLENRLRVMAGEAGYQQGFVEHYILPVLYPPGLTAEIQLVLAAIVVAINALAYGWVGWRWRHASGRKAD